MTEAIEDTSSSSAGTSSASATYPKNGLVVERVYTTEGVHPYAEVTWERRDVVMTNWRDGSVDEVRP